MIGDLVEQAERLTLQTKQRAYLFAPIGLKQARLKELRKANKDSLKRELCVRETRQ